MRQHILNKWLCPIALGLVLVTPGCKDDDVANVTPPSYEHILNKPLVDALKAQGFEFTEEGELIVNSKVVETTTLDLSSAKLKTLFGLSVFENLNTIDLSDNAFTGALDLSQLPSSVQSVNLSENDELMTYVNLSKCSFSSLLLPYQAIWNLEEVVDFAQSEHGLKSKIQFKQHDGKLLDFAFERQVPDASLASALKALYPSVFSADGTKIDVRKELTETADLVLQQSFENLTGVEYILAHPDFDPAQGKVLLKATAEKPYTLPFLAVSEEVKSLSLDHVSTPNGIRFEEASNLHQLTLQGNDAIEQVVLPESFWGENIAHTHFIDFGLTLRDCPKLEEVSMPQKPAMTGKIYLQDLPLLQKVELGQFAVFHTLALINLPAAQVTMPASLQDYADGWGGSDSQRKLILALDEDLATQSAVKSFVEMQQQVAQVIDYTKYYK